jgi:hypothetical protein
MSSNRLKYDSCAYATDIKESTSPLDYNLFEGKYLNSKSCPSSDYTNTVPFTDRTVVESELYGLTRNNTHCPKLKYDPTKEFKSALLSPPRMCENIYYITPNNLEKPTNNMLKEHNFSVNLRK